MASFTDQVPQFKEYVSQAPLLEAYVSVGQQKQAAYNEGYQRIQSQIDSIAGIDVVRDVDKQYLQSKVNELGNNLKTVAAGDFSNYQLVNSVGGMIGSISKDKNVVNAASSTAWYRKQQEKMQKDIDEGKSNPANLYNFEKQASQWFNSQSPGDKFNGQYNPYFDVDKFVKETFDAVKPDGYTSEQLYLTDDNGNIVKDKKTGQPILSPVMSKLKQEGRFPKKVEETLDQIFSDGRVQQQLSMNGEYTYRGLDSNYLKQAVIQSKNAQLAVYDDKIGELNLKKAAGDKSPDIDEQLNQLRSQKVKIGAQFEDVIGAADSNPDYVRGLLYKENTRDNYKSMYTNINEERTYEENPIWNQNFKMQQEANRMAIHRDDLRYKYTALGQDEKQHQDKLRFDINKAIQEGKLLEGPGGVQTFMPSDVDLNNTFDQNFERSALQYNDATNDLLFSTVFHNEDEINSMMKADKKLSREQAMENIIRNTAETKGETVEAFKARWSMKALNELNKEGKATPIIQSKLAKLQNTQKTFSLYSDLKSKITEQARDIKSEYMDNLAPIKYGEITLSPQDQYDMALYNNAGVFSDKDLKNEAKAALERLEKKGISQGVIMSINKAYSSAPLESFGDKSSKAFRGLLEEVAKPEFVQNVKDRAAAIQKFYNFSPVLSKNVAFGKEEEIKNRYDQIAGLIGEYQRAGKNLSPNFSDKAASMADIANDPKKGTIRIESSKNEITGETTPKFAFYDTAGSFVGEMTVTPQQAQSVGFNVGSWYTSDAVKMAEMKLTATGSNTTNSGGLEKIDDPYTYRVNDVLYNKNDFPNLRTLKGIDVKANVAVDNGQYFSYVYVNSDGKEYIKPISDPKPSMDEAVQLLNALNPQIIQAIIADKQNQK